jgi:hypothetical protein
MLLLALTKSPNISKSMNFTLNTLRSASRPNWQPHSSKFHQSRSSFQIFKGPPNSTKQSTFAKSWTKLRSLRWHGFTGRFIGDRVNIFTLIHMGSFEHFNHLFILIIYFILIILKILFILLILVLLIIFNILFILFILLILLILIILNILIILLKLSI